MPRADENDLNVTIILELATLSFQVLHSENFI